MRTHISIIVLLLLCANFNAQESKSIVQKLNTFLPNNVAGYTQLNDFRNGIDEMLRGCFKVYKQGDSNEKRINVSISKTELREISNNNLFPGTVPMAETTINGYAAHEQKETEIISALLQISVNGKLISLSGGKQVTLADLKAFAQSLNYSLIQNL